MTFRRVALAATVALVATVAAAAVGSVRELATDDAGTTCQASFATGPGE